METEEIMVNEICPSSTQVWLRRGAILVDVRETDEVAMLSYDVPGLIHIPISEFENRFKELPLDKELVIACRSGVRSLSAAAYLLHNGYNFDKVVNMKHGIIRWVHKGFPVKGDITLAGPKPATTGCCSSGAEKNHTHSCSCSHTKN
jgi:rhodanese-related sulfurtransferase